MAELLAPAGKMEALIAAISNGCDAVYLGMQKFGARAYSNNFDEETLKQAIEYAHLRNVKVYVTMNTIVFENEIEDMEKQVDLINELGADGVIVQDMAVFNYIVDHYEDLEAHCSTQMGIDDLDGTLLWKSLGAKRVVLSREVPIEKIKEIRKQAELPIEIFIHGALCVSYSGNCLMSGLIGYRSGNRGRCVGSCRKLYELIDTTTNTSLGKSFILSTKDLKTIEHIDELKELDSLKIEGRMKESEYVANVVDIYRKGLDGKLTKKDIENLNKTFNRTYTKGYMFHEDKKDISNIQRSNNFGYEIGRISAYSKGRYEIKLKEPLYQNDIIRIDHQNEDVNLSVARLYDQRDRLINMAEKVAYIKIKERLSVGDIVYKTKDYNYYKELEGKLEYEFRRFNLDIRVIAKVNAPLIIDSRGLGVKYHYESEEILGEAIKAPTTLETITKQFNRLNDTIFTLGKVDYKDFNAFVPVKLLNNARREIVQGLYEAKINSKSKKTREPSIKPKISFELRAPHLTAAVTNQEQYDACREAGIEEIYFDHIIRRNQNDYKPMEGTLLIGGYGGIYHYKDTNPFITDYSLNVVNSSSVYSLHRLGASRVTLSYEINEKQIRQLIGAYIQENDGSPRLEMIVYGRAPLMFTKYCPLKKMNQCGNCKKKQYVIKDDFGSFPVLSHEDCTTTILNGKILNLLDEIDHLQGIDAYRLNFTIESKEEVKRIAEAAKGKLMGINKETLFNPQTDTRGHFNKEID